MDVIELRQSLLHVSNGVIKLEFRTSKDHEGRNNGLNLELTQLYDNWRFRFYRHSITYFEPFLMERG